MEQQFAVSHVSIEQIPIDSQTQTSWMCACECACECACVPMFACDFVNNFTPQNDDNYCLAKTANEVHWGEKCKYAHVIGQQFILLTVPVAGMSHVTHLATHQVHL